MTLASTIPILPQAPQLYAVPVCVFVSDATASTEVWRAPDNGSGLPNDAASALATTLLPAPVGGTTFYDPLPNDGAKRFYKSRHVDAAGNASLFTAYSDGSAPVAVMSTNVVAPMAAFGAIVDQAPPSTLYEMRLASTYVDPDTVDGLQSYIDFPAATNFMRIGQTPVAISSSTNANPIVVTTSTNHGYATGDVVTIRGHLVNTTANGTWTVTVLSNTTFSIPVAGIGVGGATGHVVRLRLTVDPAGNLSIYGGGLFTGQINISASAQSVGLGSFAIILRDPNVAHGMTSLVTTDTYGLLGIRGSTQGGLEITSFGSDVNTALLLQGTNTGTSTTTAVVAIEAYKKSGTTRAALAGTDLAFAVFSGPAGSSSPLMSLTGAGYLSARVGGSTAVGKVPVIVGDFSYAAASNSGTEVSLASLTMPASTLAQNQDILMVTFHGHYAIGSSNGSSIFITFKFGGTSYVLQGTTEALGVGDVPFTGIFMLTRTGASAYIGNFHLLQGRKASGTTDGVNVAIDGTGTDSLTANVLLDIRGHVTTGGGTATVVIDGAIAVVYPF